MYGQRQSIRRQNNPVIVWVHGGALTVGAGSLDLYNGSPLAKKGAVAVNSPPLL
jgi:carboxylesterase type B